MAAIIGATEQAPVVIVIVVTVLCGVIAIITMAGTGKTYAEIGGGPQHGDRGDAPTAVADERDEVRQLVLASNHRRERRGEPPLDVERKVERQLRELI